MKPTEEACLGDTPRYTPRRTHGCHLGSKPGFLTYIGQKRLFISLSFGATVDFENLSSGEVQLR